MQGRDLFEKLLSAFFQKPLLPLLRLIGKHEEEDRIPDLDKRLVVEALRLVFADGLTVNHDRVF